MRKLLVSIIVVIFCILSAAAYGATEYETLRLNREQIENNVSAGNVVFQMMSTTVTSKKIEIENEALNYLEKKGLKLTIQTPKVEMVIGPEMFVTEEWKQALKSGEPLTVRIILKKGDLTKVADRFDEWYYNQLGLSRFGDVAYDLTAEILVGGIKEYEINQFAQPMILNIQYDYLSAAETVNEDSLEFYLYNEPGEKWDYVKSAVDKEKKIISIDAGKTGLFTLLSNKSPKEFSDISGHWAKSDIEFMVKKNIVQVTGDKKFYPNREITRAEFAVFLVRTLGLGENLQGSKSFKDVTSDKSYYREVLAAANSGIVTGASEDRFNPDAKIARQEMAVMLDRALKYAKISVIANQDLVNKFADGKQIAPWAKDSVAAAVTTGVMGGRENNSFAPKSFASRAEAVVILHRLLNITNK